MKKHHGFQVLIFSILMTSSGFGQPMPQYHIRHNFLVAPASTFGTGLVGFANPANLAFLKTMDSKLYGSVEQNKSLSLRDWGVFSGIRGLGFGVLSQKIGDIRITDYRLSSGVMVDDVAVGFSYCWSSGKQNAMGRERLVSTGAIYRPFRQLSLGFIGNVTLKSHVYEGVAEIGLRPLGTPAFTLFADAALQKNMEISDLKWSAGAAVRLAPGIHLSGRIFDNRAFALGLSVNIGRESGSAQSHFDSNKQNSYNSFMLRYGDMQPSLYPRLFEQKKKYFAASLKGRINYQKYLLLDKNTHRFMDILKNIRAASRDIRVNVIALNLSGMSIYPEHAWEIREELKIAQQAGKRILVFIDNSRMTLYHLASVADKIILDPQGSIMLPGYLLGRTYFKNTLKKLGLGFDEWRFYKYKSAAEVLSRKEMSDADREQNQAFVDDWYEHVRSDICQSRSITPPQFDDFVDNQVYLMPNSALDAGLVDTLARWSAIEDIIKKWTNSELESLAANELLDNALAQQTWGVLPKVAVVYGLGVCDMDEGIKARWLEKIFFDLANDDNVKAVVFRVDSPGGDGMASDLVAEALKQCSKAKPVIVSQGQVAGSGGYWISMYADTIVAGPNTITGSIGVIGGWLWDKGISERMGMAADHVKRGAHADWEFGVRLPYLGLQIPARQLTNNERAKMESIIRGLYTDFVNKVAQGRKMPVSQVEDIAQGHFYSGLDGKSIGLVDEIGGLFFAIGLALQKAGLSFDDEIEIVETPKYKGLLNIQTNILPFQKMSMDDPVIQYLKMYTKNNGKPMPLLLPGTYPSID